MNFPATGTPYAHPSQPPETFDCWTLMVYLREGMGLPTPPVSAPWGPQSMTEAVKFEMWQWQLVGDRHDGDVVLMTPDHVGLLLSDRVAHATPGTGVLYTPLRAILRRFPRTGVYRPCQ